MITLSYYIFLRDYQDKWYKIVNFLIQVMRLSLISPSDNKNAKKTFNATIYLLIVDDFRLH